MSPIFIAACVIAVILAVFLIAWNIIEWKRKMDQINGDVSTLKMEVLDSDKPNSRLPEFDLYGLSYYRPEPLIKRLKDAEQRLCHQEKINELLLEKLGVEFVKITEENGHKEVAEVLRPIPKDKSKERSA